MNILHSKCNSHIDAKQHVQTKHINEIFYVLLYRNELVKDLASIRCPYLFIFEIFILSFQ